MINCYYNYSSKRTGVQGSEVLVFGSLVDPELLERSILNR